MRYSVPSTRVTTLTTRSQRQAPSYSPPLLASHLHSKLHCGPASPGAAEGVLSSVFNNLGVRVLPWDTEDRGLDVFRLRLDQNPGLPFLTAPLGSYLQKELHALEPQWMKARAPKRSGSSDMSLRFVFPAGDLQMTPRSLNDPSLRRRLTLPTNCTGNHTVLDLQHAEELS